MGWIKAVTPQQLNEVTGGIYQGQWMPEMDRCWIREEDDVQVCSRLIRTKIGKVEHVTITKGITTDGSGDLSWSEKQQIKDELFGENRPAVEVFPRAKELVDVCDVYHLWVFDKNYVMPFGIHPKQFQPAIKRGALKLTDKEFDKLEEYYNAKDQFYSKG